MRLTEFWPWLSRHRLRFFAEGDGGPDGGDAVATAEPAEWMGDYAYFDNNPEAVQAFGKYGDAEAAFKGAHEAIKRFGKPFHLPEDASKLTEEHRAEIETWRAKARGVPESPEGYEIQIPEGVHVDEQTLTEFKALAHAKRLTLEEAQGFVNLQLALVDRMNKTRDKHIQGMTHQNYQTFLKEDCGGDADLANTRLELVKRYLQTFCVDQDGNLDPVVWEKYATRKMVGDRFIELIDLRAHYDAARMKMGTGGSLGGPGGAPMPQGGIQYPEMRNNLKR